MSLTIFDTIILTILVASSMLGMYRGLAQLSISFVSFIASFFVAYFLYPFVALISSRYFDNNVVILIFSSIVSYIISLLTLGMMTSKLHSMVEDICGGAMDRLLGLVAGFIRGGIISMMIFTIITVFASISYLKAETLEDIVQRIDRDKYPKWLIRSLSFRYLEQVSNSLISSIPADILVSIKLPKFNKSTDDLTNNSVFDHINIKTHTVPDSAIKINPELRDHLEHELDDLLAK